MKIEYQSYIEFYSREVNKILRAMLVQSFKHDQLQKSYNSKIDECYQCSEFSTAITSVINNQTGINNDQSYKLFSNDKSDLWGKIKIETMNLEHSTTFQQESVMQKQQQEEQQISQDEQSYFNFATTMDYNEGITYKVAYACHECNYHVISNHILSHNHIKYNLHSV